MGKFLDKKQQVFDFKLTAYGKHLLAEGTLRPTYYAFFDDNIIYDISYLGDADGTARSSSIAGVTTARMSETQNNIQHRIKNETQYLEGQILYEEIESLSIASYTDSGYDVDMSIDENRTITYDSIAVPTKNIPRKDVFRFEQMIGDAFLEGNTQNAPAWKLVTLQGQISSSQSTQISGTAGATNDIQIPQINIDLVYNLKVGKTTELAFASPDLFDVEKDFASLMMFGSENYISLEKDDLMIYAEELNTILLNKNFDVEVFEITGSEPGAEDILHRKDFMKDFRALHGQNITDEYIKNIELGPTEPDTNNVEYYFNISVDHEINKQAACKGAEIFNKDSYYIDIDFDCKEEDMDIVYYDIYGPVTEPEICQ